MTDSEDQLVTHIYNELDRATEYADQALRENRKTAWDYYLNRPRGDEKAGRSKVQDTSVRDTVHAMLAQIMPAYATDHIAKFEPFGPDDIDDADAESQAVNRIFTEDNQGYTQLRAAIHDALLFRNGVLKVWVEDVTEIIHKRYRAPAADVLAGLEIPENETWEVESEDDGVTRFKITRETQKFHVSAIEQAMLFLDPNQADQQLQECGFIAELVYYTRSELVDMGIPKTQVDELPANADETQVSGGGGSNVDLLAKRIDGVNTTHSETSGDRETVECYWVHMDIDRDGDGISEKNRFLVSNRMILLDDPVDFYPYASGTGWPVPHRWSGLSIFDLERITQDERTNARRQLADNLNVANNQRPVFDPGETEIEDVTDGAPGRGIRSQNPGNVGWVPVTDITANSINFLTYMDKVRSEQTGAALEMQTGDGQLIREASGISADIQMQPREMTAADVARNIAESLVRNTFLLIHATLRRDWLGTIVYQKSGDWQETDPGQWEPRKSLNVAVGLSPGERRRASSALQYVHQLQLQLIQGGAANITTDWEGFYKSIHDWMAGAELDSTEGYFIDPNSTESQQAQQVAAQNAERQAQVQQQEAEWLRQMEERKQALEERKQLADETEAAQKLQFDYFEANLRYQSEGEQRDAEERARQAEEDRAGGEGESAGGESEATAGSG